MKLSKLPEAIICDLDGTLALFGDANPYDRNFLEDVVNKPVLSIIQNFSDMHQIIFVSGRKSKFRKQTIQWLREQLGWLTKDIDEFLFMPRADDDNRKDVIIKQEIYEARIKGKYNILFILDDRNQVVDFWRSQGLTCFQVAPGNF